MPLSSRGGPTAGVELYVRSLAPRTGRNRVISTVEQLETLVENGTLGAHEVHVTGEAIPTRPGDCVTAVGRDLTARFAEFRDWANRTGRSLGPGFDHRRIRSRYTGEKYDAVVPPMLCLAEFVDGQLRFVSPCLEEGRPVTVDQRMAEMARYAPTTGGGGHRGVTTKPSEASRLLTDR